VQAGYSTPVDEEFVKTGKRSALNTKTSPAFLVFVQENTRKLHPLTKSPKEPFCKGEEGRRKMKMEYAVR